MSTSSAWIKTDILKYSAIVYIYYYDLLSAIISALILSDLEFLGVQSVLTNPPYIQQLML